MPVAENAEAADIAVTARVENVNKISRLGHGGGGTAASGLRIKQKELRAANCERRYSAAACVYSEEQAMIVAEGERSLRMERINRATTSVAAGREGSGKLKRPVVLTDVCIDPVIIGGIRHHKNRTVVLLRDCTIGRHSHSCDC